MIPSSNDELATPSPIPIASTAMWENGILSVCANSLIFEIIASVLILSNDSLLYSSSPSQNENFVLSDPSPAISTVMYFESSLSIVFENTSTNEL